MPIPASDLYTPWSAIFVPNCSTCQVVTNTDQALGRIAHGGDHPIGSIDGYLQLDQYNRLVYVSPDFVPFDTVDPAAPSGVLRPVVDGAVDPQYSSFVPQGSGFIVEALSRTDLAIQGETVFPVGGNGQAAAYELNAENMATLLMSYVGQPNTLVIVQSFGTLSPVLPAVQGAWARIGRAIHLLGGNESRFDTIGSGNNAYLWSTFDCDSEPLDQCEPDFLADDTSQGGYALVGGSGLEAEALEAVGSDGGQVRLDGVLGREPGTNLFAPLSGDSSMAFDQSLTEAAYPAPGQTPTPFPTYTGGPGIAFTDIVAAINARGQRVNPDLRSSYWQDINGRDWKRNLTLVKRFNCRTLSKRDRCPAVQKQIEKEIKDVITLWVNFSSSNSLLQSSTIWSALSSNSNLDLQAMASALIQNTSIPPTQSSGAPGWLGSVEGTIGAVAGVGATIAGVSGPEAAPVAVALGAISAAAVVAATFVTDSGGSDSSSPIADQVDVTAAQLAPQIQSQFLDLHDNILRLGEMFVTSWSSLQTMVGQIKAGEFTVNNLQIQAQIEQDLQQAAVQQIYAGLLPLAFWAYVATPPDTRSLSTRLPMPNCGPPGWEYDALTSASMESAVFEGATDMQLTPAFYWIAYKDQNYNSPCWGSDNPGKPQGAGAPAWLGQALFGPFGDTTQIPGTDASINDADFQFRAVFRARPSRLFLGTGQSRGVSVHLADLPEPRLSVAPDQRTARPVGGRRAVDGRRRRIGPGHRGHRGPGKYPRCHVGRWRPVARPPDDRVGLFLAVGRGRTGRCPQRRPAHHRRGGTEREPRRLLADV